MYTTILADPPWPYKDRLPGPGRGAAKHYDLMTMDEIKALLPSLQREGIIEVADDAHLYLWTTNGFVHDAWEVALAWGFTPKTLVTWVKTRDVTLVGNALQVGSDPRVQIGMGWSFRNCTEQVIIAKRGRLPFRERWRPNLLFAPRGQHSRKPELFYDIIEKMSPPEYLELFARPPVRDGWGVWGNEIV